MNITILGAGAYALGIAIRFNKNNNKVVVWSAVKDEIDTLLKNRMNDAALPNVKLPKNIVFTSNIEKALKNSDLIVIAVSTKYIRGVCNLIKPYVFNKHILIASKGIEKQTLCFPSEIVRKSLNTKRIATISGPTFAKDMALNSLVSLSVATKNNNTKKVVIDALGNNLMKLKSTNDVIGVEFCGVIKNIIAIDCGLLEGLKASESTKAMFLTECLNYTRILIKKMGGYDQTIYSYAGFGDILLTCTSTSSRNYSFGKLVGESSSKETIEQYLKNNTVEGFYNLKSIYHLLKIRKISLPFVNVTYDILYNSRNPKEILDILSIR